MQFRTFALIALALVATQAQAAVVSKKARANDVASTYVLDDGRLYRTIVRGDNTLNCDITTRVQDFKVSQHPNDVAMIYFIKDGDFVALVNDGNQVTSGCPKAIKTVLLKNVKEKNGKFMYNVVSTTKTTLVNAVLSSDGTFRAGKNSGTPFLAQGVEDFALNECYGSTKSFNSYVAFLLMDNGTIFRVKGLNPEGSKVVAGTYSSVAEFKSRENVCK